MPLPVRPRGIRRFFNPTGWRIGIPGITRHVAAQAPRTLHVSFDGNVPGHVKAHRRRINRIAHTSRKRNQQLAKSR